MKTNLIPETASYQTNTGQKSHGSPQGCTVRPRNGAGQSSMKWVGAGGVCVFSMLPSFFSPDS
jgi:hypothetical protein